MIDFTKPVQTRSGKSVRILCTDGPQECEVVGIVEGEHVVRTWELNGLHTYPSFDLINPVTEYSGWALLVFNNRKEPGMYYKVFDTIEEAINKACDFNSDYKIIPIRWQV